MNTIKMITLCVGLTLIAPGISLAKEWRGIVPLHSTCEDVKRILGIERCETSSYQLKDETVFIYFAEYTCREKGLGEWNVPPGTVTGITVYPKNKTRLSELRLDEKKYKKVREADAPSNVYYVDEEEGFKISVSNGEVTGFSFLPAAKDSHLRCPDSPASISAERKETSSLILFDKYNNLSFDEEKKRLNIFALLLQREPEGWGYIMVYAGRRARVGEAKERAERVKEYLVNRRRIERERIVISDGDITKSSRLNFGLGRAARPRQPHSHLLPQAKCKSLRLAAQRMSPVLHNHIVNSASHVSSCLQQDSQIKNACGKPQESGQPFLTGALDEARRRLQENLECAKLFGGEKDALKKLAELKFKFGSLDNQGIAEIKGKNVLLDSGRFSAQGAPLAFATNIRQSTVQGHPSTSFTLKTLTVTGSTFGAFVLLHALGHRRKIYGQYDKDGGSQYNNLPTGANNEKIRASCFGELRP